MHNVRSKGPHILVVSPWGVSGGYSGPIVLLNRLFSSMSFKHGAKVDVAFRHRGLDIVPEWVNSGFPLVRSRSSLFSTLDRLRWILEIAKFIRRHGSRYDVIHIQGCYMLNVLPFMGSRHRSKLVALPVLDGGDLTTARSGGVAYIKGRVLRHVLSRARFALSLAPGITKDLESIGLPGSRILAVPNVVDPDVFYSQPRTLNSDSIILGFVGKLGETKQPHLLLEAIRLLRDKGYGVKGLFVGPFENASYEDLFRQKMSDLELQDVIELAGYQVDTASYFQRMDFFALLSKAEGMPGALVEALACGIPAVVTDVGSMRQVVEAANAGLVIEASGQSMAHALTTLIEDAELRLAMRASSAEYAERELSSHAVSSQYLQFLELNK